MKRKRKLKSFQFKGVGLVDSDFIHAMQTVVIYYTLKGQKIRRIWYFKMTDEFHLDMMQNKKVFAHFIWDRFKTSLNIKHTK